MYLRRPVLFGKLVKRYKRFLADIILENGRTITAHCPNSGSMKACAEPGWKVMVSDSLNPARKLRYTWEMVHNGCCWIGINTQRPNNIVFEGIQQGQIPELAGYDVILKEQKYSMNSRIDLLLKKASESCYVEVKNVTLVEGGIFMFPDAVTERGLKHLNDLLAVRQSGHRAVMLYLIQRNDGHLFSPCYDIDAAYSEKLEQVCWQGVEILPYVAHVSPAGIIVSHKVDYTFDKKVVAK